MTTTLPDGVLDLVHVAVDRAGLGITREQVATDAARGTWYTDLAQDAYALGLSRDAATVQKLCQVAIDDWQRECTRLKAQLASVTGERNAARDGNERRDAQLAEFRNRLTGPTADLPTVTLPWTDHGLRIEVDGEGDIHLAEDPFAGTLAFNADEATETAAAFLAAARASRDITSGRAVIALRAPALAAVPSATDVPEPPDGTVLRHTKPNPCAGEPGCPDQIVTVAWRDDYHANAEGRWCSSSTAWAEQMHSWAEIYGDGTGVTVLYPPGLRLAPTATTLKRGPWRWELQVAGRVGSWEVRDHRELAAGADPEHLARLIADQHLVDRPADLAGTPWRVFIWPAYATILTPETAVARVTSAGMKPHQAFGAGGLAAVLQPGRDSKQ